MFERVAVTGVPRNGPRSGPYSLFSIVAYVFAVCPCKKLRGKKIQDKHRGYREKQKRQGLRVLPFSVISVPSVVKKFLTVAVACKN
jgi:hypothetical protein